MNRARVRMFERLREAGHGPADALAVVNAAAVCPSCAGARVAARRGDAGFCFECRRAWSFDARTAVTARLPVVTPDADEPCGNDTIVAEVYADGTYGPIRRLGASLPIGGAR